MALESSARLPPGHDEVRILSHCWPGALLAFWGETGKHFGRIEPLPEIPISGMGEMIPTIEIIITRNDEECLEVEAGSIDVSPSWRFQSRLSEVEE
jgi:hypothetical protein